MPRVSLVCNLSSVLLSSYSFVLYSVSSLSRLPCFSFSFVSLTIRVYDDSVLVLARGQQEPDAKPKEQPLCLAKETAFDCSVSTTYVCCRHSFPRPSPLPRPLPPPPAAPPLKAEYSSVTVTPEYIRNSIPDNAAAWLHAGLPSYMPRHCTLH